MSDYISALLQHWDSLMSGIVSVAMGVGLRIGKRVSGRMKNWSDVPDWIFVLIGVVCLFFAGYRAWQDQHVRASGFESELKQERDNGRPKLQGRIDGISVAPAGKHNEDSIVSIEGVIKNQGAPSVLDNWDVKLKFSDKEIVKGEPMIMPDQDINLGDDKGATEIVLRR